MNARQAAKKAAARIEELEDFNRRSAADVRGLYRAIDRLIAGECICDICEEQNECTKPEKDKKTCSGWWLTMDTSKLTDEKGETANENEGPEGVLDGSSKGGKGTPDITGAVGTL